ncbi:hypothetical protein LCGC14_0547070 [marine sediment metagenome]|uniref:Uncharacterized protein n=1 Tax=marine sediment metagenome TaxID=412755 RepID=A0A0F9RR05_9ZZZZ
MIAVYYNTDSSPFTMVVLEVEDDDHSKFLDLVGDIEHPLPSAEVLFIENDQVVSHFDYSPC